MNDQEAESASTRAIRLYKERRVKQLTAMREAGFSQPHVAVPNSAANIEARQWYSSHVVLLLVETTCRCGEVWQCPEPELYVTRSNMHTGVDWTVSTPLGLVPPHIPRTIQTQQRSCEACPSCFSGDAAPGQYKLFDPRIEFPLHNEYPVESPAHAEAQHGLTMEDL